MKELEKIVDTKVKPIIDEAMHDTLGITISELETEIAKKLQDPLVEFHIDSSLSFKEAKRRFKQQYVLKALRLNLGSIERTAKTTGLDRRSVHRFVADANVNVDELRSTAKYVKQEAVRDIIEESLEHYKSALNPVKYQALYKQAPKISHDIVRELPEKLVPLKDAEREFEKAFIERALRENNNNISRTARKIGLRFETLHRKIKKLKIKN